MVNYTVVTIDQVDDDDDIVALFVIALARNCQLTNFILPVVSCLATSATNRSRCVVKVYVIIFLLQHSFVCD